MSNSLWAGALRYGTAANKPTVPDLPSETVGFYYESDTGVLNVGYAGGSAWTSYSGGQSGIQPTPTAKTGTTITLTVAELLTRIITSTQTAAVGITLPTGTLTDAGFLGGTAKNDQSFEWTLINLGSSSGAVTMNAGTDHTYVGSATVAIATSARFRTRKTAANTYVTYRIA